MATLLAELEEVATLSFGKEVGGRETRTTFPKIANRALVKRGEHDAAVESFTVSLNSISDGIEEEVLRCSFALKATVEKTDELVGSLFAEMNKDSLLVTKEARYLSECWAQVDQLLQRRAREVSGFGAELEALERGRADSAGSELRKLVDLLLGVAFKSPGEIERLVEGEAFDLNTVIIANRRSHAELLAMLERQDVAVGLRAIGDWRGRQEAWRLLRHERALREFKEVLSSRAFTCPAARSAVFERFKAQQRVVFAERARLVLALSEMRGPRAGLSTVAVARSKQRFKECFEQEDEAICAHEQELERLAECAQEQAETLRESLRLELHAYGALEDEPDLEQHAAYCEQLVTACDLEVLFRCAGGLKLELRELCGELRSASLAYDVPLATCARRLDVILCGADLRGTLEKQGKSSVLKQLHDTLERLRKAGKSEVVGLLPHLRSQLGELLAVSQLDELLVEQLRESAEDLVALTKDLDYRSGGRASQMSSRSRASSARSKVSNAGKSQASQRSLAGGASQRSLGGGGSLRSVGASSFRSGASAAASEAGTTLGGGTTVGGGGGGPEVNMLEVRLIQKRVAMHVRCCELRPEALQELRQCRASLSRKRSCNAKIDTVVEAECHAVMAQRRAEHSALAASCVSFLERQASDVLDKCCRVCDFYAAVAAAIEDNARLERECDEHMLDSLFELKDQHKERDAELEREVAEQLHKVRHAAADAELDASFDNVLATLDEIEAKYRVYHSDAALKSAEHPLQEQEEQLRFEQVLCKMLGLEQPRDDGHHHEAASLQGDAASQAPAPAEDSTPALLLEGEQGLTAAFEEEEEENTAGCEDDCDDEELERRGFFKVSPASAKAYPVVTSLETLVKNLLTCAKPSDRDDQPPGATPAALSGDACEEDPPSNTNEDPNEEEAASLVSAAEEEDIEGSLYWVPGFIEKSAEELAEFAEKTLEEYLDRRDASLRVLAAEELEALSEDEQAEFANLTNLVAVRRIEQKKAAVKKAELLEKERLECLAPPRDADAVPCVLEVAVKEPEVVDMVSRLRRSVVLDCERRCVRRRASVASLAATRLRELTEELEERLRTHWPRKGRSEVSFRQPREGELIVHRQRKERHVRLVRRRDAQHSLELDQGLARAETRVAVFRDAIQDLEGSLERQGSLAGLQGAESRCKKLVAAFQEECSQLAKHLARFTDLEPRKLAALNEAMLRSTKLFCDGGDYSEKESDELKDKLRMLSGSVERSVEVRNGKVSTLDDEQRDAVSALVNFKTKSASCLHELSLREGLGMKYGAPRRNAQEKLRTEQTRDEVEAKELDQLLDDLELKCLRAKALEDCDGHVNLADTPPPPPARREQETSILNRLEQARSLSLKRATYLDFLPVPASIQTDLDAPEAANGTDESAAAAAARTISSVVNEVEQVCREETRVLYAAEGKEDRLTSEGVPESLKHWLVESRKKVLGENGYRERAARHVKAQTKRLERLVAKQLPADPLALGAPSAVLADCARCASHLQDTLRETRELKFAKQLAVWLRARDAHRAKLRPHLGRPDATGELRALCAAESARRDEVKAAVCACRDDVLTAQSQGARDFATDLLRVSKRVLLVLDNLVFCEDLGYLPGDEHLEHKRKSLKRLLKAARHAVPKTTQEDARPGSGGDPAAAAAAAAADDTASGELAFGAGTGRDFQKRDWPALACDCAAEQDADAWTDVQQIAQTPQTSFVTTAHRALVKARDARFHEFMRTYKETQHEVTAKYTALLDDEDTWQTKWKGLVASLVAAE